MFNHKPVEVLDACRDIAEDFYLRFGRLGGASQAKERSENPSLNWSQRAHWKMIRLLVLRRGRWTVEPTHYQVYETVSEGTPVTPHFATKEELIEHLVKYGDRWDQLRGQGGWTREAAEQFVKREWAPSMIITPERGVLTARDGI